jgi:hypothetical protein
MARLTGVLLGVQRVILVAALSVSVTAAKPFPQTTPVDSPAIPTVSFTLDFPESVPSHYSIRVAKDGKAIYESIGKLTPEADGDPFSYTFRVSDANLARLFELAAGAKYFEGDVDYRKGRQANTGRKTLGYQDATRRHEAEFNYSTHQEIQKLTAIFQRIALTMEFARHLQYFHHYQRLALEEELKRMEEMAKRNDFEELQALAPVLQEIVDDKSILNVTRARAQRLLARPS